VVASALLVDYVLTVAVSIASAAANIGSAVPFVATHKVEFAVGHGVSVLVELPIGQPDYDLRAMYYSTMHWRGLVNGYSGMHFLSSIRTSGPS